MRLIDADEYEKRIKPYDTEDAMDKALYNFAHTHLIETPTVEKKGKWIEEDIHSNWSDWTLYFCSECGRQFKDLEERNYCPNCGARMEE